METTARRLAGATLAADAEDEARQLILERDLVVRTLSPLLNAPPRPRDAVATGKRVSIHSASGPLPYGMLTLPSPHAASAAAFAAAAASRFAFAAAAFSALAFALASAS